MQNYSEESDVEKKYLCHIIITYRFLRIICWQMLIALLFAYAFFKSV